MRIAICDDDERELAHLSGLIAEYQLSRGISVDCHIFRNSTEFLCDMKGGEYDLVLLDVLMPGTGGAQAARELRELDRNVKFIIISSSSEFAVESYRVGAYDYLLKPADADLLFPLMDKVGREMSVQDEQGLVLKNRKSILRVSFARIEYVEVINKTVFFHLADGIIHEVIAALADFEEQFLARPEFFKPHRSYLVNANHVQAMEADCVVTKNGHIIPVSRQRRSQIQNIYMEFLNQEKEDIVISDRKAAFSEEPERFRGSWKILLVDDDAADRTFWSDILRSHGCIVYLAENFENALKLAEEESCDCVLLDVMIPGEDGFSICERLHERMQVPIIFLSCLTESDKQVEGFAAGGIDYITKDTSAELFWAKVETRMKLSVSERTRFCYGSLLLDLAERRVLINEKEVFLTSIEFDLLWGLSQHTDRIVTPKEIFDMIWGGHPWDGGQVVQIHMSRLRRKLEKAWAKHHFIETVWGQGYRFVPEEH